MTAASRLLVVQPPLGILLMFVDDLGYGDLGFTGNPSAHTPALDRFASEGRRLPNWYSAYPVCSASRTALLTGRQPPRVGMVGVINSLTAAGLPLSEVTIADELRRAGYATLGLGKWHQGQRPQYLPLQRGFDEFYGLPFSVDDGSGFLSPCNNASSSAAAAAAAAAAVERLHPLGSQLGPLLPLPLLHQRRKDNLSRIVEQPTDLRLLTSRLLGKAREFVGAHAGKRWFTYFAFGHVHTATADISADRQYAGCPYAGTTPRPFLDALAEVDGAAGELLGDISALGIANSTLTIFVSDNGPSLRWGVGAGSAGIFTGAAAAFANGTHYANTAKGSTWEGGVRMPAFIHFPGSVAPGTPAASVGGTRGVRPSLMRLAGLAPPTERIIDGTLSLFDAIVGDGSLPTRHAFLPLYNNPVYGNASKHIFAARFGRYKAHWLTSPGLTPNSGHVPSPSLQHEPPLVFDVEADPSEAFPLDAAALPRTLLAELAAKKKEAEAQLQPTAITAEWAYKYALCCGYGCKPPCTCACKDVPLPMP
jgi:arylsulfatase A